jgi:hypothetical protein
MSIIGILTLKNIRQFRRQINPLVIQRLANRDINQLCKSLSVQMITLIILTIPHSCYYLYSGFTSSQHIIKTNLTVHYEKLTLNLVRLLLYIQMIISKIYREEFLRVIENLKRFIQRNIFARFFFCMTNWICMDYLGMYYYQWINIVIQIFIFQKHFLSKLIVVNNWLWLSRFFFHSSLFVHYFSVG